jgi:hypothetical protein
VGAAKFETGCATVNVREFLKSKPGRFPDESCILIAGLLNANWAWPLIEANMKKKKSV